MKIDPTGPPNVSTEPERLARRTVGRPLDVASPSGVPQDHSNFSSILQKLVADASQVSDIREDRVAPLREAIAQNHYQVSNSDVAEAMFNTLFEKTNGGS